MTVAPLYRFAQNERATSALEFALVVVPFLLLVVGTIEIGRLLWIRQAMQSLAISTARCMGVLEQDCVASGVYSPAQAVAHLISESSSFGVALTAGDVVLNAKTNCGAVTGFSSVEISYTFTTVTPILSVLVGSIPLTAVACFPNQS